MGNLFQFATRLGTETEAIFTSVERVSTPVPQESTLWRAPDAVHDVSVDPASQADGGLVDGVVHADQQRSLAVSEAAVDAAWPRVGRVVFRNVAVRYRHGLPFTLNGVSFTVPGGHRVGECDDSYRHVLCCTAAVIVRANVTQAWSVALAQANQLWA